MGRCDKLSELCALRDTTNQKTMADELAKYAWERTLSATRSYHFGTSASWPQTSKGTGYANA